MAISKIPSAGFQDNVKFRNIIINGDMSIAQRGTSQSSVTSGGYKTLDRFRMGGTVPGTWTWSQSTDVPTGQGFANSMKLDNTVAVPSLAVNDTFAIQQRIEAQNLQYLKKGTSSAESVTLSFWVKSNKTGTYICELEDSDNNRHISKSYTINSANTWEKKTITYEGDTTGTLNNDNGTGFHLQFWLAVGTDSSSGTLQTTWSDSVQANTAVGQVNLADSTSNEWYITGVQLEAGEVASDFEFLPHDVNLQRCLRYYELLAQGSLITFGNTNYYNSTQIYSSQKTKVPMRSTPSLDYVTGSNYYRAYRNNSFDQFNVITLGNANNRNYELKTTTGISGTAGHGAFLRTASASSFVALSSEL